jgi:hypothetical protein
MTHQPKLEWEMIAAQLPDGWRELATEMKVIRPLPEYLGTKIKDIDTAMRLVFHHVAGSSLRMTTAVGAAADIVAISPVALHKWMKKLGPYIARLLVQMVDGAAFAPEKWAGFDVIVADASTVQRPGSKGTTARVHYALRLADLTPRHMEVTDEHGGETARRFRAEPGELWLLDRAYANPPGTGSIFDRGAHVVVRYNRGSLPVLTVHGERIDVMDLLRATRDREQVHECRAYVPEGDRWIPGRLCWLRLPEQKAAAARERAQKEGSCDEDALDASEFVVIFTTIVTELSAAQLLDLYRARWQVELEFKRAKSIGDLDRLPNFLPETIYTWICAKLLLQLVAKRIASPAVAFPPGVELRVLSALGAPYAKPSSRRRRALVRRQVRLGRRMRRPAPGRAA